MPIALAVVSKAAMPAAFLYSERCACERSSVDKAFRLLPKTTSCEVAAPCLPNTYATLAACFVRRTYYASVLA